MSTPSTGAALFSSVAYIASDFTEIKSYLALKTFLITMYVVGRTYWNLPGFRR